MRHRAEPIRIVRAGLETTEVIKQYIKRGDKYVRNPLIGENDLGKYITEKTAKFGDENRAFKVYTGPEVEPKDLPKGISSAELLVDINDGQYHKMELKGGFIGIQQSLTDFALRPAIGWAVIETGEQPDKEAIQRYKEFIQFREKQKPVGSDTVKKRKN